MSGSSSTVLEPKAPTAQETDQSIPFLLASNTGDRNVDIAFTRWWDNRPIEELANDPRYYAGSVIGFQNKLMYMSSKGIDVSKLSVSELNRLFEEEMNFQAEAIMAMSGAAVTIAKNLGTTAVNTVRAVNSKNALVDVAEGTSSTANKLLKFKGDEAVVHFERHGKEIMDALGISEYNLKNYIDDANFIVNNGQYVKELNGYVRLIGGQGSAKYGFVGLDRATGNITTFHIKPASELAKKAPSLGIVK